MARLRAILLSVRRCWRVQARTFNMPGRLGYTRRLFTKFCLRVPKAMEINPILNSIKDLSERSQTIRGYL